MQYLHSKKKIHKDLTELGLKEGMFVNLKCSYNSIGKIEGGPMSLIEIILNIIKENGLLITDSFVDCYKINSLEFKKNIVNQKTKSYAGLIANTILDHIDCKRSFHPIQKFALIGNYANELSINHTEKHYAYDILKIISHEKNSFNLRIGPDNKVLGVGTTHVATGVLNIEKYEKNLGVLYEDKDKNKLLFKRDWIGICSNTLINLNYFYENNSNIEMKRGKVGGAKSLLTNMNQTLNEELNLFKKNILNLDCNKKYCYDCFRIKENYKNKFRYFIGSLTGLNFKSAYKVLFKNDLTLQPKFKI